MKLNIIRNLSPHLTDTIFEPGAFGVPSKSHKSFICSEGEGTEGGAPLPGDFRVIICSNPPQMNDFCDLLGTPDAPILKIVSVYTLDSSCNNMKIINL